MQEHGGWFREIVEQSADLIILLDLEIRPVYISPALYRMTGYTPESLGIISPESLISSLFPQDEEAVLDSVQRAIKGERVEPRELKMRRRDGTSCPVDISVLPVVLDGVSSGVQLVIRDVSSRNQADAETHALIMQIAGTTGDHSLRMITIALCTWLKADGVLIGEIQPDVGFVTILAMYLDREEKAGYRYPLTGSPCEAVITGGMRIYPDNVTASFPDCRALHQLDVRGYIGVPLKNSDGHVFGVLCALFRRQVDVPVPVQNLLEIVAVKVAADIERMQIEKALRKNQKMLAEAMDLAQLVNWEYDAIGDEFTFNDRFYAMYGTTAEREGGYRMSSSRYAQEFMHPDDRGLVALEVQKALCATDPDFVSQQEHRIIRRDGEIRHIVVRFGITKDTRGRTIQTHGANQDITDRKRGELALRQANRQLNLLTGITRHDILNMVTVIQMILDTVTMKFTDRALHWYLDELRTVTGKIQNQIEFTRAYEALGLHEPVWQRVQDLCRKLQVPDHITLHCEADDGSIYADPMLGKVFFNLLDNSVRHGQHVTEIHFSSYKDAGFWILVWEDNGTGIPLEDKGLIFDKGFGKNTGLGMFLVREILLLTGISIRETGQPGCGARFEIAIPGECWREG